MVFTNSFVGNTYEVCLTMTELKMLREREIGRETGISVSGNSSGAESANKSVSAKPFDRLISMDLEKALDWTDGRDGTNRSVSLTIV
jgi:hypothetical protein